MAMSAGSVDVKVGLDDREFNRGMKSLDKRLGGFDKASKLAFRAGAVAVGGFGAALVGVAKLAGDFEQSLNVFQSVSGATASQMKGVSDKARQLGSDLSLPATSAKDAADAMLELSKGGLDVTQTMAAARGVLQLSAAASIDNATAATITARALQAFGLAGSEAGRVADVLANAANSSTGEITDFALGLQQSSAVAKLWGLTLNETTAALMQLADAGVVGSDAGTSLKTMLQSLKPSSKDAAEAMRALGIDVFDGSGKFVGIRETVHQYSKALQGMTQEQQIAALKTIFGSDAIRAANIVLGQGAAAYGGYLEKTEKSGTAASTAAAKMKGFNGAVAGLRSVLETLAIDIGTKALPALTELVNKFSKWIGNAENAERIQRAATKAVETFSSVAQTAWPIAQRLADSLSSIAQAVGGWENAFKIITGGVLVSKVLGLAGAFGVGAGVAGQAGVATAQLGLLGTSLKLLTRAAGWAVVVKLVVDAAGLTELPTAIWKKTFGKIPFLGPLGETPSKAEAARRAAAASAADVTGGIFNEGAFGSSLGMLKPKVRATGSILGPGARVIRTPSSASAAAVRVVNTVRNEDDVSGGSTSGSGETAAEKREKLFQERLTVLRAKAAEDARASVLKHQGMQERAEAVQANLDVMELAREELKVSKVAEVRERARQDAEASVRKHQGMQERAEAVQANMDHMAQVRLEQKQAREKASVEKAIGVLAAIRERAASAFARVSGRITSAFDAMTAAHRTSSESALAGIAERRQQEDSARAVADAEARLAEVRAKTGSSPAEIAMAEQRLADTRAKTGSSAAEIAMAEQRLADLRAQKDASPAEIAMAEQRLEDVRANTGSTAAEIASAEERLADVRANTGSTAAEIADAERTLARAREDITITSLEKTAAAERTNYEAGRENLKLSLEDRLTQIQGHFTKEGSTTAGLTKSILDTLGEFGVDFSTVGGRLGQEFITGLNEAISKAALVAPAVAAALEKTKPVATAAVEKTKPAVKSKLMDFSDFQYFAHGGVVKAKPGGTLAVIGEGGRDEAVIPLSRAGLDGGGTVVNINVSGSLIHERELENLIARASQSWSRRNGPLLSRTAGARA